MACNRQPETFYTKEKSIWNRQRFGLWWNSEKHSGFVRVPCPLHERSNGAYSMWDLGPFISSCCCLVFSWHYWKKKKEYWSTQDDFFPKLLSHPLPPWLWGHDNNEKIEIQASAQLGLSDSSIFMSCCIYMLKYTHPPTEILSILPSLYDFFWWFVQMYSLWNQFKVHTNDASWASWSKNPL